ncbi:MAG TPA: hypothetical protein VEG64_09040 [Candidatus Sulfotelmatobacter sp.]|nr:hypothetical protein [Candidatus Sulfotelmatobacter sp.]
MGSFAAIVPLVVPLVAIILAFAAVVAHAGTTGISSIGCAVYATGVLTATRIDNSSTKTAATNVGGVTAVSACVNRPIATVVTVAAVAAVANTAATTTTSSSTAVTTGKEQAVWINGM